MKSGSQFSPFGKGRDLAVTTEHVFAWMNSAIKAGADAAELLAADINQSGDDLTVNEVASILRALRKDCPELSPNDEETFCCVVLGSNDDQELFLSNAVAQALGFNVLFNTFSLQTGPTKLVQDSMAAVTFGANGYVVHDATSWLSTLQSGIALSSRSDVGWSAVQVLAQALAVGALETVCIDIKVGGGARPHSYEDAFELGLFLVKAAYVAGMKCRVLLSDYQGTSGFSVGRGAELAELAQNARVPDQSPYAEIVHRLVASLVELSEETHRPIRLFPNKVTATRGAISSGKALAVLQRWSVLDEEHDAPTPSIPEYSSSVCSSDSGYLKEVNYPLLRTALKAVEKQEPSDLKGEMGIRVLRSIGERVSVGDAIAEVVRYDALVPSRNISQVVQQAFTIGRERPILPTPVRVVIGLEAVLVRRWYVVVVPIRRNHQGAWEVLVLRDATETGVPFISKSIGPRYSQPLVDQTVVDLKQRFLLGTTLQNAVQSEQISDIAYIYDFDSDRLLSRRYSIVVCEVLATDSKPEFGEWIPIKDYHPSQSAEGLGIHFATVEKVWRAVHDTLPQFHES